MKLPRSEQETIFTYNINENWHISTDVSKHIRKYLPLVKDPVTREENGEIIYLEGFINGNVTARAKKVMTAEQKEAIAERFQKAREEKKLEE